MHLEIGRLVTQDVSAFGSRFKQGLQAVQMAFHSAKVLLNHGGIQWGEAVIFGFRLDLEFPGDFLNTLVTLDESLVPVSLLNPLTVRPQHFLLDRSKRCPVSHHPKKRQLETSISRVIMLGRVRW